MTYTTINNRFNIDCTSSHPIILGLLHSAG